MSRRIIPAALIALGFETLTLSNSTAGGLNSTNAPASSVIFSVETNNVRVRSDGTNAALTTGVLYQKDDTYFLDGFVGSALSFQRSTGTCKVSIEAFERP